MNDFEVHIELAGLVHRVGLAHCRNVRGREAVSFRYDPSWLVNPKKFALEPALPLGRGEFMPAPGQAIFGSIGDSAPDTWGRRLMQRAERRRADAERRRPRTLTETDYLLGVADETRLGALRFRRVGEQAFQASDGRGVPSIVELGRLLQVTERLIREEETEEDLLLIFAPGSSLGGARPKASIIDQHGNLSIAKFPKETDQYSIETWESIALTLAERAGILTARHELLAVAGKAVLLSKRFDRTATGRIPFMSAMALMQAKDGETGSYPEIVDLLTRHSGKAREDAHQLYRRVVFNVMISNVDDHLRNHGFLWNQRDGWRLSPAYDLNPVPADIKAAILTTNITLEEGTCSVSLLEEAAELFGLKLAGARSIIKEVAMATADWRTVASGAGVRRQEIERMASAFEHDEHEKALQL